MFRPRVAITLVFLAFLPWPVAGDEPAADGERPLVVDSSRSSIYQSPFSELSGQRRRAVEELVSTLESLPPSGQADEFVDENVMFDAIMLLGEYRAVEASDPLAKRLDWLPRSASAAYDQDAPTIIRFPAASALIHIGQPAVPRLLEIIERSDSTELERRLAALTLLRIAVIPSDDFETDDTLAKERLLLLFEQRKQHASPATIKTYARIIEWLKDYEEQHKDPRTIPGFLPDTTTADAPNE